MDNNVVLTLRMEQLDSEDGDGIINTYPAKYRKVGDWHVFSYEETVSSDPGDRTKNLLKIRDEEVILIKKGTINSTMEFRNDDVFRGFYDTPYGALQMVLNTGLVQMTNDPDTIKELELEGEPDLYTAIEYLVDKSVIGLFFCSTIAIASSKSLVESCIHSRSSSTAFSDNLFPCFFISR